MRRAYNKIVRGSAGSHEFEYWIDAFIPTVGRTAIDIGAHEGLFLRKLRQGSWDKIVLFEPDARSIPILKKYMQSNTILFEVALSDKAGYERLYRFENKSMSSLVIQQSKNTGKSQPSVEVRTTTLDEMRFDNVDFIKIDCEGSEMKILKGAWSTLESWRPMLLIEVHTPENYRWLMEELSRRRYKLTTIQTPEKYRKPDFNQHLFARSVS